MERLTDAGFAEPLTELDVPLLGICVGLQLLFDAAEEDGTRCLGLIGGTVELLEGTPRLPHIGWNGICIAQNSPIMSGIRGSQKLYFVHSYHVVPKDKSAVLTTTDYGYRFVSSIQLGNMVRFSQGRQAGRRWNTNLHNRSLGLLVIPCFLIDSFIRAISQ